MAIILDYTVKNVKILGPGTDGKWRTVPKNSIEYQWEDETTIAIFDRRSPQKALVKSSFANITNGVTDVLFASAAALETFIDTNFFFNGVGASGSAYIKKHTLAGTFTLTHDDLKYITIYEATIVSVGQVGNMPVIIDASVHNKVAGTVDLTDYAASYTDIVIIKGIYD